MSCECINCSGKAERWSDIRQEVLKRDDYTCQRCKQHKVRLAVHHIIRGGESCIKNLMTLCNVCHPIVESSGKQPQTTILIDMDVRDRLRGLGTKGQTYSQILASLMDGADKK